MRTIDNYIPIELWREAKEFVKNVQDDVDIYKLYQKTGSITPCEEADKFCAYWNMESYEKHPHALITLYEYKPLIDKKYDIGNVMNAFECLQMRFKTYYLVLKEKGMTDE